MTVYEIVMLPHVTQERKHGISARDAVNALTNEQLLIAISDAFDKRIVQLFEAFVSGAGR